MGQFLEDYKDYVTKIQTRKIVLFCAGQRSIDILNGFYKYPYSEIAFICDNDSSKWGTKLYTLNICNPEVLRKNPDEYVVLICIYDDYKLKRIEEQLQKNGVSNVYSSAILCLSNQIERYNPDGTMKYHELNTYKVIEQHKEEIDMVLSLLEDDKSKEIYQKFVEKEGIIVYLRIKQMLIYFYLI